MNRGIGLMSGTSLDGLDICYLEINPNESGYKTTGLITATIPYSTFWLNQLKLAFNMSPDRLDQLDLDYGKYLGQLTKEFIDSNHLNGKVDFIASHGHTIFHEPKKGFTKQIGAGQEIADTCQVKVVNDFRSLDVQLGGQGAPLVPIGDKYLFNEFDACINLGGFSNISFDKNGKRIAFDLSPCNLPLNAICTQFFDRPYDENGALCKAGKVLDSMLIELNQLTYYAEQPPKSLGVEWLNDFFNPILERYKYENPLDILSTIGQHIAVQIAEVLNRNQLNKVLITGGGVYNQFIIGKLKELFKGELIIPSPEIIEFKEAIIFALLGYLRLESKINTLSSVTGAVRDSSGGKLHLPI